MKKFGVQVVYGFFGKVTNTVVAFTGSIVLARFLGPVEYGAFFFLLSVIRLFNNPISGWIEACRKRVREKDFPEGEALGASLIGIAISGVVFVSGAYIANPLISEHVDVKTPWIHLSLLFFGLLVYITSVKFLRVTENFGSADWFHGGRDISRIILQVSLVFLGFGVLGMVGGLVLANFIIAPIILYYIGTKPEVPSRESLSEIWAFARSSIPIGFVGSALNRMDILLLGFVVGSGVVGNYQVAIQLTLPAIFMRGVMEGGLVGEVSELESRGEDFSHKVVHNTSYVSILAIPIFFGSFVMGDILVETIYSNQYELAGTFIAGLALFRVFRSQSGIYNATLSGLDRPDLNLKAVSIVFVVNITLGLFLLFEIGSIGVVYATVLGSFLGWSIRAYFIKSLFNFPLIPKTLRHQVFSGGIMAIVVYTLRYTQNLNPFSVFAIVGVGAVIYFVTLILISKELRVTVKNISSDLLEKDVADQQHSR